MDTEQPASVHDSATDETGAVSAVQARAFLGDRFGHDVGGVSAIGYGEWSRAYTFRRDGGDYVVRFGGYREDFDKDCLAARFGSKDLPIPRVTEIGDAFGGFYAISERAFGDYLDDLDEKGMRALLPALFGALDAARQVDLSSSVGYGGWGSDGRAPHASWRATLLDDAHDRPEDRTYGWRDRLATSPTGSEPFEEALAILRSLVDRCPEERHLIHSDLLHFNVLVADGRITAVVDWGCAMYGDFLYDVAWFAFWSPWYPAWRGIDFPHEAARHFASVGLEVPHFEERLRCCQIHIGLAGQAYNAFKGRWEELEETAARTIEVGRSLR
jgi:hygromycin-B 4-O-kinase